MTETHPSREEWIARQATAPAGFHALIAARDAELIAMDAALKAAREARARDLDAALQGFEFAIDLLLAGHDWIRPYRTDLARVFTEHSGYWLAQFDLGPIGAHQLVIEIPCRPTTSDRFRVVWSPGEARFIVFDPRRKTGHDSLASAIYAAAQYAPTPF